MVAHTGFLIFGRPVTRRTRPGQEGEEPQPEMVEDAADPDSGNDDDLLGGG
jgi:hypothetical protein